VTACSTCAFSFVTLIEEGPVVECRRFPPVSSAELPEASVTVEFDGEDGVLLDSFTMHRFPVVHEGDWCGEWRLAGEA
jgi:hypothetical protein